MTKINDLTLSLLLKAGMSANDLSKELPPAYTDVVLLLSECGLSDHLLAAIWYLLRADEVHWFSAQQNIERSRYQILRYEQELKRNEAQHL